MVFLQLGGNYNITNGMIMIPFIFGVGIIFYNSRNILGWMLSIGSIFGLIFGAISPIRFSFKTMTSFDFIVILVLAMSGLGLLLHS
tara:strand:- start:994 stop:1251 length:258 start_codon:yes stop_codon:yes gene_type:complete